MPKDYSKKIYKSKRWQIVRHQVLVRDNYLCQRTINGVKCERPATEVHHIEYITPSNVNDPNITYDQDNLISLCWKCHNDIHHQGSSTQDGLMFDSEGNIVQTELMKGINHK